MPPSLREWLPEEHLAWFVLDAVAEMDLAAFYAAYRDDGWGRAAHDPAMMVALFVYAYAIGVRSSRAIERRCRDDVAFRVITANQAPDHATIARFRVRHEAAIAGLFGEVLALCARSRPGQGRRRRGRRHEDRRGGDASRDAQLRADRPGDPRGRRAHRRRRGRAVRRGARRRAARGAAHERGSPQGPARGQAGAGGRARRRRPRRSRAIARERLVECRRRLRQDWELERHVVAEHAAWHAAGIASDGSRRMVGARHNIKPYPLPTEPAGKINVTDPDSRNLKTTRGWVQGYNAQAVVGEGQIVLAAEISTESLDTANLQPMIQTAIGELEARRRHRHARGRVGRRRLLDATTRSRRSAARASRRSSRPTPTAAKNHGPAAAAAAMTSRGASWRPTGASSSTSSAKARVEPVFGQIKSNRGADRFQRRGRSAVRSEWRLLDGDPQPAQAPPTPTRHRLISKGRAATTPTQPHRRLFDSTPGLSRLLPGSPAGGPASRQVSSRSPRTQLTFARHPPRKAAVAEAESLDS